MVHLLIKHCLNRCLPNEIIWPVIRRKELSLPPKDTHSLHIRVAFSLQAANRSTQATGQLHTSKELPKKEGNYIISSIFCLKSIPLGSTDTQMWIHKAACTRTFTHTTKTPQQNEDLFSVLKHFHNNFCSP